MWMNLQKLIIKTNKKKNLVFVGNFTNLASWKSPTKWASRIRMQIGIYGSKDPDPYQNVTDLEHWFPRTSVGDPLHFGVDPSPAPDPQPHCFQS